MSEAPSVLDRVKEKVGGNSGLAAALGDLTPQAVSQWKAIPASRCIAVSRATGIPLHELRPDIYPKPTPLETGETLNA